MMRNRVGFQIRHRMVGRAVLLAMGLTILVAPVAYARLGSSISHICDTTVYSECVSDDNYVSVSVWVTGTYATQTKAAMAYYSSSEVPYIVMYESYPAPPTFANVRVGSVSSTFAALAWTKCSGESVYGGSDAAHTRWCSPQDFYYNTYYAASYYPTDAKKRYIACHELGHTFGLQHPKSSEPQATCMVSARMGSNPYVPTYNYISATEKNQISSYYGSGQVSI